MGIWRCPLKVRKLFIFLKKSGFAKNKSWYPEMEKRLIVNVASELNVEKSVGEGQAFAYLKGIILFLRILSFHDIITDDSLQAIPHIYKS